MKTPKKAFEDPRGCGYRKAGGLYLVGPGLAVPCDMLPLELVECPFCGYNPPFTRGYAWIRKAYIQWQSDQHHHKLKEAEKQCQCVGGCPLCSPGTAYGDQYGLMWVGKDYTPESFIKEAHRLGVSKRVSAIPKDMILGKTWVLLAYRKFPFTREGKVWKFNQGMVPHEPIEKPAVFYAFIPQRVEMPIFRKDATKKKLKELKEQGITPVIIPDDCDAHRTGGKKK